MQIFSMFYKVFDKKSTPAHANKSARANTSSGALKAKLFQTSN